MGLCGRRTERACMIYPEPPKTVFQRSAQPAPAWEVCFLMPGLLSCAAGIPIPPKTIRQAFCISVHTYAKCLLGSGTQTPEKRRHSTCGAFARQHKRPLPGDWGQPPTSRFSRFSRRRKRENRFVCTTKHCLPLLRTAIEEVRLIPIRRTIPNAHSRIICIL